MANKTHKQKSQNRKWYHRHREEQILKMKAYRQATKDIVYEFYGGYVCKCCGITEPSMLGLDHINNDGAEHRRQIGNRGGMGLYLWIIDNDFPPMFQVYCFNCNQSKRINGGVCSHQKDITMGHSFEQSGPGDTIMNMHRPEGHAHLDQKLDKGMRSPILSQLPMDAGLVSPETSAQTGSGHGDSGYSGSGSGYGTR
jgi:hypothetical protein